MAATDHPPGAKHPYHLVDPSPWPLLTAFSVGGLATGAVLYMHDRGPWLMLAGLVFLLVCAALWWRDVVLEAHGGHHTSTVAIGLRVGMGLFIASEVMFFVAFFWAFFDMSIFPRAGIDHLWPPAGIVPFNPFGLPFLNTLILLLSGTTVTWAHHALMQRSRRDLIVGLALTIALGLTFTGLQAFEYAHAAFSFKEGIYPSTFYMATGFHGFHVIVGTLFLAVCLFRVIKGHFTPARHIGFEAAAWYWHFVDVVWLFLFVWVYWWGKGNAVTL